MSGCRQYVTPWLFSMCGMTRGLRKLTGEQWWDPFVYVLLWGLVLKRARCQTNHLQQWNLNGLHCCILLYAVRFCFNAVCVSFFCLCIKYLWNCCADLHQIHMEDVFGPSLERVWMSRSPGTKRAVYSYHPRQRRNGTCWLQITLCSSRRDHFVAAGGDFGCCVRFIFGKTSLALVF